MLVIIKAWLLLKEHLVEPWRTAPIWTHEKAADGSLAENDPKALRCKKGPSPIVPHVLFLDVPGAERMRPHVRAVICNETFVGQQFWLCHSVEKVPACSGRNLRLLSDALCS